MPLKIKILAAFFAFIFFLILINVAKKTTLKPFYSFLWIMISILMFAVVVFEGLFKKFASFLGIIDASFLVIISVIFFLLIYVLHLSVKISEMSDRIQELISMTAILEKRIRDDD